MSTAAPKRSSPLLARSIPDVPGQRSGWQHRGVSTPGADAVLRIEKEPAGGDLAQALLRRYYDELDERLPGGFALELTVAAPSAELTPPRGAFMVVRLDGDPMGCGGVRKLDEQTAEIKRMWLDPRARGHGVGRRLLHALETAAEELGCKSVRLDTSAHLSEAITLYRSCGYVDIPPYNDNLYADYWLEKTLGG